MIGASQVWPSASAWNDWIAAGLKKNSPGIHDMIDRRVLAFLQGLAAMAETEVRAYFQRYGLPSQLE